MSKVCPSCGDFNHPQLQRRPGGARCPACGHLDSLTFLPLFIVTGPSGSGKSAVVPALRRLLPDWDVFETDILWDSGGSWETVKCNWLRIAHSIAQSGRGTVLCGTILPEQIRNCNHLAFFSRIHYLALVCEENVLRNRLRARPAWRGCTEEFIAEQVKLLRWLREQSGAAFDPPFVAVDTTCQAVEDTASRIAEWVRDCWNEAGHNPDGKRGKS